MEGKGCTRRIECSVVLGIGKEGDKGEREFEAVR